MNDTILLLNSTTSPTDAEAVSEEVQFLTRLTVIMACIGTGGCLITLILYHVFKRTQGIFTKYVWWMNITELVVCLNYIIMPYDGAASIIGLCRFHGWLMQFSELAEVSWNLIVNFIIFYFFYCSTYHIHRLKDLEKNTKKDIAIHSFVWGFAFVDATILVIINQYQADFVWCWISGDLFRVIFWYVPLWTMFLISLSLFIGTCILSYKIEIATKSISSGEHLKKSLTQFKIIRTTGLYFILSFLFAWLAPTVNRLTHFATQNNPPYWIWLWHILTGERMDGITKCILYNVIVLLVYRSPGAIPNPKKYVTAETL